MFELEKCSLFLIGKNWFLMLLMRYSSKNVYCAGKTSWANKGYVLPPPSPMPIRMTWFFIGKWYCNKTLFSSQNPTLGLIWGQGVTFDVFEGAGLIFTHKLPWFECYIELCKTTLFYLPLPCHPLSFARPPPIIFCELLPYSPITRFWWSNLWIASCIMLKRIPSH